MSIEFLPQNINISNQNVCCFQIQVNDKVKNDNMNKILSILNGQYIINDKIYILRKLKFEISKDVNSEINSLCEINDSKIKLSINLKNDKIIITLRYDYLNSHFYLFQILPYKIEISNNNNNSVMDKKKDDNHTDKVKNIKNSNNSIHSENPNQIIENLLNSQIGLINVSGSCAIASIIQVLAHSKYFLQYFYQESDTPLKKISNALKNLFYCMSSRKQVYLKEEFHKFFLEIKNFFKLNKFESTYFLNLLIHQLDKENNGKISQIFAGKSIINCYNYNYSNNYNSSSFNYNNNYNNLYYYTKNYNPSSFNSRNNYNSSTQIQDSFLIYMLNIYNNQTIEEFFIKGQTLNNEDSKKFQIEKIIETSKIFIINLRCNNNKVEFPSSLQINEKSYNLYGINKYNDNHSKS